VPTADIEFKGLANNSKIRFIACPDCEMLVMKSKERLSL